MGVRGLLKRLRGNFLIPLESLNNTHMQVNSNNFSAIKFPVQKRLNFSSAAALALLLACSGAGSGAGKSHGGGNTTQPPDNGTQPDLFIAPDCQNNPGHREITIPHSAGGAYTRSIIVDTSNDFEGAENRLSASGSKDIYISYDAVNIYIGFGSENMAVDNKAFYIAIDTDPESNTLGSAILPYGQWFEGSTMYLPFKADVLYFSKYFTEAAEKYRRVFDNERGFFLAREPDPAGFQAVHGSTHSEFSIARTALGNPEKIAIMVYARDLASNCAGSCPSSVGYGWLFGSLDTALSGAGDRTAETFYAFDFSSSAAPAEYAARRRFANGTLHARIYQLFVRLFGNTNESRIVNGTLAQNGSGRFADISDTAIDRLKELCLTHVWLTGVPQHMTTTDTSATGGEAADDPDLLKGRAGSPYAIRDYFDTNPDLAVNPANRLTEFDALVTRLHAKNLKVMIDLVPNHVARSYASSVTTGCTGGSCANYDFGGVVRHASGCSSETTATSAPGFFNICNNFFYVTHAAPAWGTKLKLPTVDGFSGGMSPTCQQLGNCDGWFDGESSFARVTGNNAIDWNPNADSWYETVKLNYGYCFATYDNCSANERRFPHNANPTLNSGQVPDTWLKMDEVVRYWQVAHNVDGFRVDMAHMVPPEFWGWLINRAKQRDPQVLFVAEGYNSDPAAVKVGSNVYHDLLHAGFDAVYDDDTYDTLKDIFDASATADDLDTVLNSAGGISSAVFANRVRYAENHDEVRLASAGNWDNRGAVAGRAVTALLTGISTGPVMFYNGQEVGEPAVGAEGFGGNDGRSSIFDYWSMPEFTKWVNSGAYDGGRLSVQQKELRSFYVSLGSLLSQEPFVSGNFYGVNWANNNGRYVYAYLRYTDTEKALVVVNLGAAFSSGLSVRIPQQAFDALYGAGWFVTNGTVNLRFAEKLMRRSSEPQFTRNHTVSSIATTGVAIDSMSGWSAFVFRIETDD